MLVDVTCVYNINIKVLFCVYAYAEIDTGKGGVGPVHHQDKGGPADHLAGLSEAVQCFIIKSVLLHLFLNTSETVSFHALIKASDLRSWQNLEIGRILL